MALSERDIKRRIKSVTNTKKITKAMELVSAAKMRKTIERVQMSKVYAETAWDLSQRLSKRMSQHVHPLTQEREVKKVLFVVISANKGLCGPFNRDVTNIALLAAKEYEGKGIDVEFATFGKKCGVTLAARDKKIVYDFKKEDITLSSTEIEPLYKTITKDFEDKKYDAVFMFYTDFRSTLSQVATKLQLLPLIATPDSHLGSTDDINPAPVESHDYFEYTFEPGPHVVLNYLLPRLVSIQLFQAVLESNASEHSARMMAMKNATESAGEMVESLQLLYNRARQAGITQEIAEISAGRLAVS